MTVAAPIIAEFNFDRLSEFIQHFADILFLDDGVFKRDQFIFRGQGSSDYELKSSFDRRFQHIDVSERVEKYTKLIANLRGEMAAESGKMMDEDELMGLAQHHGLPTRLLDWSSSPLVAAYFAFHERVMKTSTNRYVTIWALDSNDTRIWNRKLGVQIIRLSGIANDRATRQLGYATSISTPDDTIESFVAKINPKHTVLWKFNIRVADAKNAFSFLDACNIRATALFGSIEGAMHTALERLYLED